MTTAYPLAWPAGWPRTAANARKSPRWRTGGGKTSIGKEITTAVARERLADEFERLGARSIVLSTNMELRADGQLRASAPAPSDPGAAAYFQYRGKPMVLACDRWDTVAGNIAAIAAHIDAMRGMERWGVGTTDQLFRGFEALPAPDVMDWHATLGFRRDERVTAEMLSARRRELAKRHHPDGGGSERRMADINAAADAALREIG